MRRSFEKGTKTILSRIGSSGMLVISIMAISPSRSSRTPPRAPAGAPATGSVSSTRSRTVISRTAGIGIILGRREGGYEPGRVALLCVVPSAQHGRCARTKGEKYAHLAADTVWARHGAEKLQIDPERILRRTDVSLLVVGLSSAGL